MWVADDSIAIALGAIPGNIHKSDFEYVARNSSGVFAQLLVRIALLTRGKREASLIQSEFDRASQAWAYLEDAITKGGAAGLTEKNFIHVANLTDPFLFAFLANDWTRTERFGRLARLPIMQEEGTDGESGGFHDALVKMLVALVLDDKPDFDHQYERFVKDVTKDGSAATRRYYQHYFGYPKLMAAILKRDRDDFLQTLAEQDLKFRERATDKKVDFDSLLDGFLENNTKVFDVWSVAMINFAKYRGLAIEYDNEVIPANAFAAG